MKRKRIHVVFDKSDRQWEVRREGARKPLASFRTKDAAVDAARDLAKAAHGQLVVHLKAGQIQEKRTYGKVAATVVARKLMGYTGRLDWPYRGLGGSGGYRRKPGLGGGYPGPRKR